MLAPKPPVKQRNRSKTSSKSNTDLSFLRVPVFGLKGHHKENHHFGGSTKKTTHSHANKSEENVRLSGEWMCLQTGWASSGGLGASFGCGVDFKTGNINQLKNRRNTTNQMMVVSPSSGLKGSQKEVYEVDFEAKSLFRGKPERSQ